MNAIDYEDLMQRVLDGVATPQEGAQLQTVLAGDAQLRRRYEELQHLFGILESVSELEPLPGAMEEVLQQVRQRAAVQNHSSSTPHRPQGLKASWEALRRRMSPQLGYAFATGALAGVALFIAFDGQPPGEFQVEAPGTLRWLQPLEEARIVDSVVLEAPALHAQVHTGDLAGFFFLEINAAFDAPGTIKVEWDDAQSAVLGFQRSRSQGTLTLQPTGARVDRPGENRYRFWLPAPPQGPVRVRLEAGDVVRQATLRTQSNL